MPTVWRRGEERERSELLSRKGRTWEASVCSVRNSRPFPASPYIAYMYCLIASFLSSLLLCGYFLAVIVGSGNLRTWKDDYTSYLEMHKAANAHFTGNVSDPDVYYFVADNPGDSDVAGNVVLSVWRPMFAMDGAVQVYDKDFSVSYTAREGKGVWGRNRGQCDKNVGKARDANKRGVGI